MIDHTGLTVSDFEASKAFYLAALRPIGYDLLMEFPAAVTGHSDVAGFGEPTKADFWINRGIPNKPALHIAFRVNRRALVDAFHEAALAAGGRSNGAREYGLIIIRITTEPSCSTRMATI